LFEGAKSTKAPGGDWTGFRVLDHLASGAAKSTMKSQTWTIQQEKSHNSSKATI